MSYVIRYGPDEPPGFHKRQMKTNVVLLLLVFAVFALIVYGQFPQEIELFYHNLFPWTRTEVQAAFESLKQDIRNGEFFFDAVTAFCRDVIHEAR